MIFLHLCISFLLIKKHFERIFPCMLFLFFYFDVGIIVILHSCFSLLVYAEYSTVRNGMRIWQLVKMWYKYDIRIYKSLILLRWDNKTIKSQIRRPD